MTVLLDNQPLSIDHLAPDATMAQLIDVAKAQIEGTGSVIVALRHNNEDVAVERLEQMLSEPAGSFDNVELISGRPKQVVLDALELVRQAFAESFATVREAADALGAGKVAEAMTSIAECVSIWGHTHASIVQGGALAGVDFEGLDVAGRPLVDWLNELATKLRELKDAIESRDNVLLGDILRYELDDTLRKWEQMLDGFIWHIEQMDNAAQLLPQ